LLKRINLKRPIAPKGKKLPRCKIIYRLFFIAILLCGCSTRTSMLPAQELVGESATAVMTALESYRGDAKFFIKYRSGDQILYSGGDWQDRLELSKEPVPASYASPSMLPMQFHQQDPWDSLPDDAIRIPVLGVDQWQELRDRMLRSVVPANGTGLVVDFEFMEYFLYYEPDGQFRAMRLLDKPAAYSIHERLNFIEFMRSARPLLDSFLRERGITESEFIFNTEDTGLYSLPFLYINTELRAPPVGIHSSYAAATGDHHHGSRRERWSGLWSPVKQPSA
jgi:hypothetical protein